MVCSSPAVILEGPKYSSRRLGRFERSQLKSSALRFMPYMLRAFGILSRIESSLSLSSSDRTVRVFKSRSLCCFDVPTNS